MLAAEFTATVNAELKVGELTEAITVTGESPLVDTTTAVHTQVLDREAIDVLPSGRMIQSIGQLVPGVNLSLPDVGGARAMQQTYMNTHGMTAANNTVMVDGMTDQRPAARWRGAGLHQRGDEPGDELSDLRHQRRDVGRRRAAQPDSARGRQPVRRRLPLLDPPRRLAVEQPHRSVTSTPGSQAGNAIDRIIDATFSQGGPIKKDKLWFFVTARYNSVNNFIANTFFDDGSQGIDDQYIQQALARLTWQVSPRNKLSAYFDEIDKYRGHDMQSLEDPGDRGAAVVLAGVSHRAGQVDVDGQQPHAPRSRLVEQSRVLHEQLSGRRRAGRGSRRSGSPARRASRHRAGRPQDRGDVAKHAEPRAAERPGVGVVRDRLAQHQGSAFSISGATSCTPSTPTPTSRSSIAAPLPAAPSPIPDSVIVRNTPLVYGERLNRDFGIYAQDSWRFKRLTINARHPVGDS